MVILALEQYEYLGRLGAQFTNLEACLTAKTTNQKYVADSSEGLRLRLSNTPSEIVMPTVGYYCLAGSEMVDHDIDSRPTVFDVEALKARAEQALSSAVSFLEGYDN